MTLSLYLASKTINIFLDTGQEEQEEENIYTYLDGENNVKWKPRTEKFIYIAIYEATINQKISQAYPTISEYKQTIEKALTNIENEYNRYKHKIPIHLTCTDISPVQEDKKEITIEVTQNKIKSEHRSETTNKIRNQIQFIRKHLDTTTGEKFEIMYITRKPQEKIPQKKAGKIITEEKEETSTI